jgi:prepilin peptidase CpaA
METYMTTSTPIDIFLIIYLIIVLLVAAIIDMRSYRIPNLLTYPTMATAMMYHILNDGLNGLFYSSAGLALGIGLFIVPYLMGAMGAGDAKLMGAVGAVLGPSGVLNACIFTAIAGGIYALTVLLFYYKDLRFFTRAATMFKAYIVTGSFIRIPLVEKEKKHKLSYGIAIAAGTFYILWWKLAHNSYPL